MRRRSWGLSAPLVAVVLGGCALFGGQDPPPVSEQPSPSPAQTFPSPTPSLAPGSTPQLALVRPTNPDTRLKEKKFGRSDPFKPLVEPKRKASDQPSGSGQSSSGSQQATQTQGASNRQQTTQTTGPRGTRRTTQTTGPRGTRRTTQTTGPGGTRRISRGTGFGRQRTLPPPRSGPQRTTPARRPSGPSPAGPGTQGPSPAGPGTQGPSPQLSLPTLPTTPPVQLATQVKFTGVGVVDGPATAFVTAPGENVSRLVRVGDRLSGGQVLVQEIDLSDRFEPVLVLEESGQRVLVRLGQDPVVVASASPPASGVPALFPAQF